MPRNLTKLGWGWGGGVQRGHIAFAFLVCSFADILNSYNKNEGNSSNLANPVPNTKANDTTGVDPDQTLQNASADQVYIVCHCNSFSTHQ